MPKGIVCQIKLPIEGNKYEMRKISLTLFIVFYLAICHAAPVRILIIRGGYVSAWDNACSESVSRLVSALDEVENIDIVLFPEFAFAGIDGGTVDSRPQVYFDYDDDLGFIPKPWDTTRTADIVAAERIDTLRYIAMDRGIYIWASSCCERIHGSSWSYNSIPIFHPSGRLDRIRRKVWYSSHEDTRDTTVHLDTLLLRCGERIAVMTTICYENGCLPGMLDPIEPPAPLWFLPHGTWLTHMEDNTAAAQLWERYETFPNIDQFSNFRLWGIVNDGWVRDDAVMISCDIFSRSWGAFRIDNVYLEPVAWEPLAWVRIHDTYVVVDCNVPDVDELPTAARIAIDIPEPTSLVAYPKISTGPIFIFGVYGNFVSVTNPRGIPVCEIEAENGKAIFDPNRISQPIEFGEYTFDDGFGKCSAILIQ